MGEIHKNFVFNGGLSENVPFDKSGKSAKSIDKEKLLALYKQSKEPEEEAQPGE